MSDEGKQVKKLPQFAMVLAVALIALPVRAQDTRTIREGGGWVEEVTGNLAPAPRSLRVNASMGNVTVQGGAQQNVTYTVRKRSRSDSEVSARRQFESYRVSVSRHGDMAVIEGSAEGRHFRNFNVDIVVNVPRAMESVRLNTDGGNVAVTALNGRVEAESGGGNLRLDDINGPVVAETGGGNVDVGAMGGDLVLKTGGGNIRINSAKGKVVTSTGGGRIFIGTGQQSVVAETGGGGIEISKCGGELKAQTGGGSLEVGSVGGKAVVQTGGGSIRLNGANGPVLAQTGGGSIDLLNLAFGAKAETGGGSITAEFVNGRGTLSDSYLHTSAGDVVVYLARDLKVTIRASIEAASGHKIRSDFPELRISSEGSEWGPRTIYAEGALNGGGPVLKVRTSIGDIEFRRARK